MYYYIILLHSIGSTIEKCIVCTSTVVVEQQHTAMMSKEREEIKVMKEKKIYF